MDAHECNYMFVAEEFLSGDVDNIENYFVTPQ